MTPVQKSVLLSLHSQGLGYKAIASKLGISVNTVKSYCRLHPISKKETPVRQPVESGRFCPSCGNPIPQLPNGRKRQFCSDVCRVRYWHSHADGHSKYSGTCIVCGKTFDSTHKGRKFCSHECYIKHRFHGDSSCV